MAADSKSKAMEPKPDASKDPSAGLMDMMKKMYEEGDDEMKRTIAKAWTEGQDKKVKYKVNFTASSICIISGHGRNAWDGRYAWHGRPLNLILMNQCVAFSIMVKQPI